MSKENFVSTADLIAQSTPTPAPSMPGAKQDAPKLADASDFEIHGAVYAVLIGSLAGFLGIYAVAFARNVTMGIVLAVCGLSLAAFFGLSGIVGNLKPNAPARQSFSDYMRRGVMTGSGHLSGGGATAQVVTLPLLLVGFALFVLAYTSTL
jgi:hypothetical protein